MREFIRGFGFSLSGSVDLDGNTYPDLAVGAPHSDQAVLLRYKALVVVVVHPKTFVGNGGASKFGPTLYAALHALQGVFF